MKKVFLQMMFGEPLDSRWLDLYFKNCNMLEKYGWYWKIFTPNSLLSQGNVEIVPMNLDEFDRRVEEKCGVTPNNYIDPTTKAPHKLTSDYYPAYGLILEDHTQGFDFWGHTNWDVVYGRLDHFIPDSYLADCDIFADEANEINGPFTIYRNNSLVNNLFREIPNWQHMFTDHGLFYLDETHMTQAVRKAAAEGRVRFKYPQNYPFFSYDRFPHHVPEPQLERFPDGSLYETFKDRVTGRIHGKEMSFFHFSYTKRYPDVRERN